MFITIEGGEGSSKTSVCNNLKKILPREKFFFCNDPSSASKELAYIRKILVSSDFHLTKGAELLLYGAARIQLVERFIKPALANGKTVICDRFYDSTYVYQGKLKGHSVSKLRILNEVFAGNLVPDMTILLDVDAKVGLSRSFDRLEENQINESRWEEMGLKIHEIINAEYRKLPQKEPKRFRVIDSNNLTINEMTGAALTLIDNLVERLNKNGK